MDEGTGASLIWKLLLPLLMCMNNIMYSLLTAYTRQTSVGPLYFPTTVVFLTELFKFLISCYVLLYSCKWSMPKFLKLVFYEVIAKPIEFLKLAVPAGLYAIQNNLVYVALSNLDPATYQVTTQLKIITTAVFTNMIFHVKLSSQEWVAIACLFLGVALVQLRPEMLDAPLSNGNYPLGVAAALLVSTSASLAGVYFEKLLKKSNIPFWIRSLEMYFWGLVSTIIGMMCQDWSNIKQKGFFHGYTFLTWVVIALSTLGGLYASLCLHHMNNIVKNFIASAAMFFTIFGQSFVLQTELNYFFYLGTVLVMLSLFLYGTR